MPGSSKLRSGFTKCYFEWSASSSEQPFKNYTEIEVKPSRYAPSRRLEGEWYSSSCFSSSALGGVSGKNHDLAVLYP